MAVTIRQLAAACGAEIRGGDADIAIDSAANLELAGPNQITFMANSKHLDRLRVSQASAVVVQQGLPDDVAAPGTALLAVDDPEMAFIACLEHLYPSKPKPPTLSADARIDASATVGADTFVDAFVTIGAGAVIGQRCTIHAGCRIGENVTVGDDCVLYPNVVLYHGVALANKVIIHAGSVIGADGFGYKFRNGEHIKFPQVGTVVIEANVEIGANTCIDRAALGITRIGEGTKMDNQVHIAHNVSIGARSLLCGQVGIGGSTVIEDYVVLAAQSGVADHVTVGTQALVLAQSGVTKDVAPKDQVVGFPAASRKEALREMAALRRLAGEQKAIDELLRLLPQLRALIGDDGTGVARRARTDIRPEPASDPASDAR